MALPRNEALKRLLVGVKRLPFVECRFKVGDKEGGMMKVMVARHQKN